MAESTVGDRFLDDGAMFVRKTLCQEAGGKLARQCNKFRGLLSLQELNLNCSSLQVWQVF